MKIFEIKTNGGTLYVPDPHRCSLPRFPDIKYEDAPKVKFKCDCGQMWDLDSAYVPGQGPLYMWKKSK